MDDLTNFDNLPEFSSEPADKLGNIVGRKEYDSLISAAQLAVRDVSRLTRVLSLLSDNLPVNDLLAKVLSELSELFVSEVVILLDPVGTGKYFPLAAIGLPEKNLQSGFPYSPGSHLDKVWQTGQCVNITDLTTETEIDLPLKGLGIRSCLWLPIISGEDVRGMLILARCRLLPFDQNETGQLMALSQRIGLTLEHSDRNRQIMEILENSRITHDLKEPSIVSMVVDRFLKLTGADATAIFLFNDAKNLYCAARMNIQPDQGFVYAKILEVMTSEGEISHAIIFKKNQMSTIVGQIGINFSINTLPVVSLFVPIFCDGIVIGILTAFRYYVDAFPADLLSTATLFANQTSSAIDNARLFKSLKDELVEREELSAELQVREERFRALIRNVNDVISIMTGKGRFLFVSPAAQDAWGVNSEILVGKRLMDLVHPDDTLKIRDVVSNFVYDGDEGHLRSVRMRYGENEWKDFEVTLINMVTDPVISGVVATFHDVTDRRTYEHTLKNMAYHDELTSLPNRKYYEEKLEQALESIRITGRSIVVVFMDLDSFKLINDSLGHQWGDRLLCMVADRLLGCLRREDFAARMSGDEFTILLEGITSREQVVPIMERFIHAFKDPFKLKDQDMFISGSFGAVISKGSDNSVDLLRKADMAMYQVKKQGKGGYIIIDSENQPQGLDEEANEELVMQSEMHRAFSNGEFRAAFTPIFQLDGLREMALEAQLNWMHPRRGRLKLIEFLPAAYKAGIIAAAGQWLSGEAIRQAGMWNKRREVPLYIRFPAKFIRQVEFNRWIIQKINEAEFFPGLVTLDIIADETSSEPEVLISRLQGLKEHGFRLAISDYGFNFSGLKMLSQMPVDFIRLDVSHFRELDDTQKKAILMGTSTVAHAFGNNVIIDGIESLEQAKLVQSLGYFAGMGCGLSGPLLPEEVEQRHLFGL